MSSQAVLPALKSPIQQKAIQKFPFALNNKTYFSTECYYDDTIINGISLQVKQAKGISDSQHAVSYLNFSNRLVFYAGANILSYNMYKQKYQIIYHSQNLLCLQAFSLTAAEKEYVVWVEKVQRNTQNMMSQGEKRKSFYQICVYDFTRSQKIYSQKLLTINKELKPEHVQILAFMHPDKVLGVAIYNPKTNQTQIIYKKVSNEELQFGDQNQLSFPFQLKYLKYDLESNSYFFLRNEEQIWALRSTLQMQYDSERQNTKSKAVQNDLIVDKILTLSTKKAPERKIIHFSISEAFLIILTCKSNQERELQFYSLFSYGLIFTQTIWKPEDGLEIKTQNQKSTLNYLSPDHYTMDQQESMSTTPIDLIQFNKNIIIGIRNNSTQISIYSLHGQNLRHIRNTLLDLENCYKIQRLFINPFSSEVMILSRHYQLEANAHPLFLSSSELAIIKSEKVYKKFYLEISSFFITMEASVISVQKMSLQKKNYCQILTLPWLSEFLIQTDNSFKNKRWEQKFDLSVRCSAIHPTGQYVALGFNDCFKIYFLTHEGLVHTFVAQNIKQCTSLSYSMRGNDFAVATPYSIFIYDCYSYQKKHQISLGMSYKIQEISYIEGYQNDKVKLCLQCITINKRIVTYNADKNYIEQFAFNPKSHAQQGLLIGIFDMMEKKEKRIDQGPISFFQEQFKITVRNEEKKNITKDISNNLKGNKKFGGIVYDERTKVVIFTFGPKIYFISAQNFQSLGSYDFQQVSCIQLSQCLKTIFFGTVSGKIIAFPWPNKPINITSKIPTFWAHKTRIKRIKVSSDLFDLISISEQSLYIHSLVVIKEMRKVQKHQLQREYNPQSMLATNFYLKAGICLFSADKYEDKCQIIKQNEQEAVNFNFILPEERQKQKIVMLSKLQTERQKISSCTRQLNLPLKTEAVNVKEKVKNLQKELKQNEAAYQNIVEKQIEHYQKRISQLNIEKDELRKSHNYFLKLFEDERNNFEDELKRQRRNNDIAIYTKLKEANKITESAGQQKKKHLNNFFELNEIEEEKKILNQNTLHQIQTEISNMQQRNGFLMCKNIHLQKEIFTKRRKIEDIKQLIGTTEQNISNLPRKNKMLNKSQDLKQQCQINKQFAEAEKKYLQETKKLIEKNKAINVSIELYQKERQMMVILEKKLENQQESINEIVKYISKQRENRKKIHLKLSSAAQKVNKISQQYQTINGKRIRVKNILKQYLFNLTLYQVGVIDMEKLKQISQINVEEMVRCPENIQLSIEQKKRRIGKIENSEQKILNLVKNERKIYSNEKKKTCMQNQDLLMNFNFLSHENKYLNNVMKDQKEKRRYCIKTISKRQNRKLTTKPTPFQNYINFKTGRRTKTSPCAEYDLTR